MKTKNLLTTIIFLLVSFYVHGQIPIDHENVDCFPSEKTGPANNFAVKSASENIFLLDSVLETFYLNDADSMLYFNDYYDYDDKGNITEWIHRSTCNNCAAGGNYKSEYIYDEAGNCIAEFYFDLDLITSQWVLKYKLDQNFSAGGNLLSYVLRLPQDNSDVLINYSKVEYTYNNNNEITDKVEYTWNENLYEWSPSSKWEWEFNNSGQIEKKELYSYDLLKEIWISVEENIFFYDHRGYDSIQIQAYWDEEREIWNSFTRYEHYYDSVGNEISLSVFKKDTTESWMGFNKVIKEYDEQVNIVVYEEFHWNNTDLNWEHYKKIVSDFNSNKQPVSEISYSWDNNQSAWIYSTKIEWEYDLNFQTTLQINFRWESDDYNWISLSKITYSYDASENIRVKDIYSGSAINGWVLRNHIEYFYSEFVTNINTNITESQSIKLYPNPAIEIFNIETQNPEISFGKLYNLNGELVKYLTIQQGINTYNISELKSGVYFIQIPQKEGMVVKKLVKN